MNLSYLTIAIVTYKRPLSLEKCLKSILRQTAPPSNVFIIDNDRSLSAKHVFNKYKNILPLKYFVEPIIGIPYARNFALKKCQSPYLAFVDDDCILSSNWVKAVLSSIKKRPEISFVIGKTLLSNPKQKIAKLNYQLYLKWFKNHIQIKTNIFDPTAFDTKNIVLNLKKISDIKFDTKFLNFEDIDFGLSLKQKNLIGIYNPSMAIFHPEPGSIVKTMKKNYQRGQFKFLLEQKWGNIDTYKAKTLGKLLVNILKNKPSQLLPSLFSYCFDLGYLHAKHYSLNTQYLNLPI